MTTSLSGESAQVCVRTRTGKVEAALWNNGSVCERVCVCVCECWGERKKHTHTVSWSHTLSRQRWVTQAAQVLIWKAGNRRQRACASEITVTTGPGKASVYLLNRFTPPSSLSASTSPFRFKVWRVAQMTREEIGKFWGRENVWGGSKGQLHNT